MFKIDYIKQKIKFVIKKNIIFFAAFIKNRPFLKSKLLMILNFFPQLKYKLRKIVVQEHSTVSFDVTHISPRTKKIYEELLLRQKRNAI